MRTRVQWFCIRALLVLLVTAGCAGFKWAAAAEEGGSLQGIYRDERITLELGAPLQAGDHVTYSGSIRMGEKSFPFKAEARGGQLEGTFESQGDTFEFEASSAGRMLVLTTGGTTYRLKRDSVNPLAAIPARPNPLAAPKTNAPPKQLPARPIASSKPLAPSVPILQFKRFSVLDRATMIGGEAFSVLVPNDWQVEGGVGWRMHPSLPTYVALRVINTNRSEVVEAFPVIPFVWTEGGIPLFPEGSLYLGNEVAEPIDDPAVYVRKVLLPRYRQGISGAQVVASEDLASWADVIAELSQDPAVQKKFKAGRVRVEYAENGKTYQEDFYCVLVSVFVPTTRTTYWGADRNYSFRAEKGKLDGRIGLFQTVVTSYRPNLAWFNRYAQLLQLMAQGQVDTTRPVAELSRLIAQTTDPITEARKVLFEKQQAAQDRVNAVLMNLLPGLDEYRSPFDQRLIQAPAGYSQAWTNPLGDFLLSASSSYNPNSGSSNTWRKADRVTR